MRARAHAAGAEPKKDYSFCSARGIEEEEKKRKTWDSRETEKRMTLNLLGFNCGGGGLKGFPKG